MKQLNVNKFEMKFNFVTCEDWANEEKTLFVTLKPDEFKSKGDRDNHLLIVGTLSMKYRDKEISFRHFEYSLGGDIRTDIYSYMKYDSIFCMVYPEQTETFLVFLRMIDYIKPTYTKFV